MSLEPVSCSSRVGVLVGLSGVAGWGVCAGGGLSVLAGGVAGVGVCLAGSARAVRVVVGLVSSGACLPVGFQEKKKN